MSNPFSSCGGCTQCCKTLKVSEIDKPEHTWCTACTIGVGCDRYATRPQSCVEFECVWLQSQREPGAALAPELRPDRSKVVIGLSRTRLSADDMARLRAGPERSVMVFHVDPDRPGTATAGAVRRLIERLTRAGLPVAIVCGDERRFQEVVGSTPYATSFEEAPSC